MEKKVSFEFIIISLLANVRVTALITLNNTELVGTHYHFSNSHAVRITA